MMTTEKRHCGGAIFRHCYDWRFAAFIRETWSNSADENSARAQANDGPTLLEKLREMGRGFGIGYIAARNAIGRVNFPVQFSLEFLRKRQRRNTEYEDNWLHHASPPA
jgi:hypothetical protein